MHLGGHSVEGSWDTIYNSNIVGCYNLFEAAYRSGVKRVVFASSNHAVGFYPRDQKIGVDMTVRPDSRYGVSKAFGEALGALYADKHGLRVTCIRIGNVNDKPIDQRRLSIWIKPDDLVSSSASGLTIPTSASRSSTEHPITKPGGGITAMPTVSAIARNSARKTSALKQWLHRQSFPRMRSAIVFRAGHFVRTNMTLTADGEGGRTP